MSSHIEKGKFKGDLTKYFLEATKDLTKLEPFILVLFGASGDLSKRKVMPAVYNLVVEAILPKFCLLGVSRRILNNLTFQETFFDSVIKYSYDTWRIDRWDELKHRLYGLSTDFSHKNTFDTLAETIRTIDAANNIQGNYFFYLATAPSNYSTIITILQEKGLLSPKSRIIIEKPFGLDLKSARNLHKELLAFLAPEQIFKIDHYLGKESIQNILVFRANNPLFRYIWNKEEIEKVVVLVSETAGVDKRAEYFEQTGILRDMVQSHLLQILALLTMEIPKQINPESVKRNKLKLLEAVRKFSEKDIPLNSVRGQYGPGRLFTERSGDHLVKGYREEFGIDPNSDVETFVALRLFIDNEQWMDVPFYLVTGKRMRGRLTEIKIKLREHDSSAIVSEEGRDTGNIITLRIQPDPSISIQIRWRPPGILSKISPVSLEIANESESHAEPKAYERLLLDALLGDRSNFLSQEEIEEQWKIVAPFVDAWKSTPPEGFPNYVAGSDGPEEIRRLLPDY